MDGDQKDSYSDITGVAMVIIAVPMVIEDFAMVTTEVVF